MNQIFMLTVLLNTYFIFLLLGVIKYRKVIPSSIELDSMWYEEGEEINYQLIKLSK